MSRWVDLEHALRTKNPTRFNQLLNQYFGHDINYPWGRGVTEWLFGNAGLIPPFRSDPQQSPEAQARETLCCNHLLDLLKATLSGVTPAMKQDERIGLEFDCLADRFAPDSWGIAMMLNFVMLQQIKPTRTAAALVTMRDDGLSLLEWIAHYRVLKFDHIFVFTNDNEDLSDAILRELASNNIITLIEQETSLAVSPQLRAFEYSIHFMPALRDFEWVFYLDSDEFLVLDGRYDHSIKKLLGLVRESNPGSAASAIFFKWLWYISEYRLAWDSEILLKRFQHATAHHLYKSLVRLAEVVSMRQAHFPETKESHGVMDANLNQVAETNIWPHHGSYAGGRLNHYWCKSFEEFLGKKRRGDSITGHIGNEYQRGFELFFRWNGAESPENLAQTPADLIELVEAELANLRGLPGILEKEIASREKFFALITDFVPDHDIKAFYMSLKN